MAPEASGNAVPLAPLPALLLSTAPFSSMTFVIEEESFCNTDEEEGGCEVVSVIL